MIFNLFPNIVIYVQYMQIHFYGFELYHNTYAYIYL